MSGDHSSEQYNEVASDYELYETREVLARCKDFMITIINTELAYAGKTYSIKANGNMTNFA